MDKNKIRQLCRQYENHELKIGPFTDALEKEGVSCWVAFTISDLHRKVSYLTNLSKLDEEDQIIAAKWEKERDERSQLYHQLSDAEEAGDKVKSKEILDELCKAPWECEHGRHIVKTCMSCEHIEKTLYPDMIQEDEEDEEDD